MNGETAGSPEDAGEDESEGFGSILRERVISIGSMPVRLRLITGFAIASGIAAAIATAVQALPIHFPMIELSSMNGQLVETSVPVFILTLITLIVAWTYLLTGAFHSHWAVRLVALSAFSLTMWYQRLLVSVDGLTIVAALLLGALWVWGLLTLVWDQAQKRRGNGDKRHGSRVTWTTFVVVLIMVAGLYALGYISAEQVGSTTLFASALTVNLLLLGFCLLPILLMAGVDFAEWGEIISVRVGRAANRFTPSVLPSVLTLLLSVGVAIHYIWPLRHHPNVIAETALIGGAVAVAIVAAVSWSRAADRLRAPNVPYFGIALAVLIFFAITTLGSYLYPAANPPSIHLGRTNVYLGTYSYAGAPPFSFKQPAPWESFVQQEEGKGGARFTTVQILGAKSGYAATEIIFAFPTSVIPDEPSAVRIVVQGLVGPGYPLNGLVPHFGSSSRDHGWDRIEATTTAQIPGTRLDRARIWTRVDDGHVWVLIGIAAQRDFRSDSPAFDTMAATWAPHVAVTPTREVAPKAPTNVDRFLTLALGLMVLTALGGLVITRRGLGGRLRKAISTGSLYLSVAAILAIGTSLGTVVSTLSGSDHEWLSVLRFSGVQWVIGLATMAVVVAASRPRGQRLRRLVGPLFSLNLALLFVALIYQLYSRSDRVAQFSFPQAVVLLIAFALDVVLSGESITNANSVAFPRHARVMLFFGYILLGTVVTLYFTSLRYQGTSAAVQSPFTVNAAQSGLIIFGIPVLLTIFILKVLRPPKSTQSGVATEAAVTPEVAE
jgi:hypothetical protein